MKRKLSSSTKDSNPAKSKQRKSDETITEVLNEIKQSKKEIKVEGLMRTAENQVQNGKMDTLLKEMLLIKSRINNIESK